MGTKRQEKFSRMIQKELADVLQRQSGNWIHNNIVSITRVEMSPDLSVAKIHLSFLMDASAKESFEAVNKHKNEIRRNLGNRIAKTVRIIPELVFVQDEGAANAEKMNEILRNLNIPPENNEE